MNIISKGILIVFTLFICISCGQNKNTDASMHDKKEIVKGKNNKKGKKNAKKRSKQNLYWTKLGAELITDKEQLKKIRNLNVKNNKKIEVLKGTNPKDYKEQLKKIRRGERRQVEKILGKALFQKKLDWDKKWTAENTPKPKVKATQKK